MESSIVQKLYQLQKRLKEIEKLLNENNTILNNKKISALSEEYAKINNILEYFKKWKKLKKDTYEIKKMLCDKEIYLIAQDELKQIHTKKQYIKNKLKTMLFPKNSLEITGCFLEIKAGTGGQEATLFARKLFKMYCCYAESKNWQIEIINANESEYGGYKEIIAKLGCQGAYEQLKFESGGHRVQRVPYTESQGRIHTSSCMIAVMPEIPEVTVPIINLNSLKIDTFRSSGAGGQHVNTTDSAIRITHIPSGLVVECQDERSQHKNKARALEVLKSRLHNLEIQKHKQKTNSTKKYLLGSGDRSDRIRTYNFPKNRVTDHRINLTLYRLNEIMKGKLELLIKPIMQKNKNN